MNSFATLWGRNPAMILALVGALISLGVAFGLELTAEQTGAIVAVTQIVLGLITRTQVTPNRDV